MKKLILLVLLYLAADSVSFGFWGTNKIPKDVGRSIETASEQLEFASNQNLKDKWIKSQIEAYYNLMDMISESKVPEEVLFKILKSSKDKFGANYRKQIEFFVAENQAYLDLKSLLASYDPLEVAKIEEAWKRFNVVDFSAKHKSFDSWRNFFATPFSGK